MRPGDENESQEIRAWRTTCRAQTPSDDALVVGKLRDRPPSTFQIVSSNIEAKPVVVMLDHLNQEALAELARAMECSLRPVPTPAQRRVAELGFLASLLNEIEPAPGWSFSMIERWRYDELRNAEAPSSALLVRRYGSWRGACYAAFGLQSDGRWIGPGRPWPSTTPNRRYEWRYTRDDALKALRECADDLGRRPSDHVYRRWRREKRREAHRKGMIVRLPSAGVIYRLYPRTRGGWNRALADARLGVGSR